MLNKFYYYVNESNNPHNTLAIEEYMLNHINSGEIVLYLYTHHDSVIIGKNQNAWAECRHEKLIADGGKLARRISGGGAVFHDSGNLNFSFIVDKENYDLHRQLKVMTLQKVLALMRLFQAETILWRATENFQEMLFVFAKTVLFIMEQS
ncbi:MAG: hypothetical protein RR826_04530 [Christensenellaceae bacterium]